MSPNLRETLGAILIGSGFAATLTGVVAAQTLYYFQRYPDDRSSIKVTVAVVWFLDLLHTIMVFAANWIWLIGHFHDPGAVNQIPWSLGITVFLTATVTIIVHLFFAYRIFRLSKGNWFVVGPIMTLAVIRLAFGAATCAETFVHPELIKFLEKAEWVFTVGLLTSSILDVAITACLIWYLDRSRTGFEGMDRIINTLCLYAIESGLLTSVATTTSLGFWLGMQHYGVALSIYFVLAKLYASSLLATLNGRKRMRERNHRTCSSDGAQLMTVFSLSRGPTLKPSTDNMVATRANDEKPSVRHEEAADFVLPPITSQFTMGKDSMCIASTSKL